MNVLLLLYRSYNICSVHMIYTSAPRAPQVSSTEQQSIMPWYLSTYMPSITSSFFPRYTASVHRTMQQQKRRNRPTCSGVARRSLPTFLATAVAASVARGSALKVVMTSAEPWTRGAASSPSSSPSSSLPALPQPPPARAIIGLGVTSDAAAGGAKGVADG